MLPRIPRWTVFVLTCIIIILHTDMGRNDNGKDDVKIIICYFIKKVRIFKILTVLTPFIHNTIRTTVGVPTLSTNLDGMWLKTTFNIVSSPRVCARYVSGWTARGRPWQNACTVRVSRWAPIIPDWHDTDNSRNLCGPILLRVTEWNNVANISQRRGPKKSSKYQLYF